MRTLPRLFSASLFSMALAACGASDDDDGRFTGGTSDASVSPQADAAPPVVFSTVQGTVWVPGNGPGLVPAGHEIPVFNAVVYLTDLRPEPIEDGATCRPCVEAPASAVQTDHKGNFMIQQVQAGTYWMIIEKGDFRLEQEIVVGEGEILTLDGATTTLPSSHDPENGRTIPKVAMATGQFDDLEDILGKMGLGAVNGSGAFDGPSAAGVFDFYDNGGPNAAHAVGTLGELVADLDLMLQYDIIFIPCSGSEHTDALQDAAVLGNIRDYVAAGGKLYVTDWSGEWADNVFPTQIELAGSADTPPEAYDPITDTWNTSLFGGANGSPVYNVDDGEAVNDDLRLWLDGQVGPLAGGSSGTMNATDVDIEDNWNHIVGLHSVQVGTDDMGAPIIDSPIKYVIGSDDSSGIKKPLTVTYEPTGCGRVLFSTYHTTHNTHVGLVPQERILVYLIMEIGVCKDDIVID